MMMKFIISSLLLLFCISLIESAPIVFDGHQVLRITPHTPEQLKFLKELDAKQHDFDFWVKPSIPGRDVDVRVPPSKLSNFKNSLERYGFTHRVFIEDLQRLVDLQHSPTAVTDDFYSQYHTVDEVNKWATSFAAQYPNLVSVFSIGKSYEGRDLTVLRLSAGKNKKAGAFWYDGGIHAREWITTATVLYMTNQLVLDYVNNNGTAVQLLNNLEIYVMPIFNVDGYAYTWNGDRMWRKTRSPNQGSDCVGTDPNRNWDYQWDGAGTDSDPCAEDYSGPKANSEVEIVAVTDFLYKARKTLKGYINFHSYSQLWMSPWGYTSQLPADYKVQNDLSARCVNALTAVYGTKYVYGPIATTIYPASGSSADWAYGNSSVLYSYGVELRDTGEYGFVLPPKYIVPSGIETYEGLKVFGKQILDDVLGNALFSQVN